MATAVVPGKTALALLKGDVDLDTATVKLALFTSAATFNVDTTEFVADLGAAELAGDGYARQTLTVTTAYDAANNRAEADAADVSVTVTAQKTFRYAAIIVDTGVASTSRVLSWIDYVTDQTLPVGTTTFAIDAEGWLHATV